MQFEIQKTKGSLTCWSKTEIDNKKCFVKIILGTKEENILKEFINSLNTITIKEKTNPHIFTFNRRDYMAFILSRVIKYYDKDVRMDGNPLNKWRIEDIKDKFGNFNDESILFDYFGLEKIDNKYFFVDEMYKDKQLISEFFRHATNKIYNLSLITSRILDNTYSDNYGPKVVVSLEIEPMIERKEEFKKTFPYYKDETDERILSLMKNNFAFSRLLGISICKLSNQVA